jgi:hypothetical protein
MMDERPAPPGEVTATGLLAERTERLTPLYDAAVRTLFWGFRIGAVLLAIGIGLTLISGQPLSHEADPFGTILTKVLAGNAPGVIDLAILWFMAIPVATVIVVAVSFWRLDDRRYAALSLVVLAILAVSIALALSR